MVEVNQSSISLPFNEIQIPFILYIILVLIGLFLVGGIVLYFMYDWNLGKSLRIFFTTRIEKWRNPSLAIFEILTLSNNVKFEQCIGNRDSGYIKLVNRQLNKPVRVINRKKLGIGFAVATILLFTWSVVAVFYLNLSTSYSFIGLISYIIPTYIYVKRSYKIQNNESNTISENGERNASYIIPKSIYSINNIDVVPLLDLHPNIPKEIAIGVNKLTKNGIKTLSELKEMIDKEPNKILYDNVTYESFLYIYVSFKNKYNVNVKVSDVLNFISSNVDENFRESLEIKDYNESTHKKLSDKYIKYCYIGILLMCLAFFFRVIYRTIYG